MNPRASLPAVALATLLAGCAVKPSATVEIFQVCSPPTPGTDGGCTWPTGSCTTTPLGRYWLDVDLTTVFEIGLEVHNQLADNSSPDTGGQNTHNAFLDGYATTYSAPIAIPGSGGTIVSTVPTSGSTVTLVEVVNGAAMDALYTRLHGTTDVLDITASTKLTGRWGDQSKLETAPRSFGISVCAGCLGIPTCEAGKSLVSCPAGHIGQYPITYSCGGSAAPASFTIGGTVTGLTNGNLVLSCPGLSNVTVAANSGSSQPFTFPGSLPDGTSYTCAIDPSSTTTQTCTFAGGSNSGTVSGASVTSIAVGCI